MNSAIIGLGVIANVHVDAIKAIDGTIVSVCDIDLEKAKDFVKRHNLNCKIYKSYKAMLTKEKIDVVHICTPHYLHENMCIFALNHNINVLCEKPLCISLTGIDNILEAAKHSKAKIGVCLQNRYNESNLYVKNLLAKEKVIGGFATVLWGRDKKYYDSGAWRGKKRTEGGGVMINQALHTLDLMQWFCGMPTKVNASVFNVNHSYIEVEDTARARFETKDGSFEFYASICQNKDFPVQVLIETNTKQITITDNNVIVNSKPKSFEEIPTQSIKACYGNGHTKLISDFYDCVENNKKFDIDAKEAAKVVKLVLGMYRSKGKDILI